MNILVLEDDRKTGAFIVRGFTELGHNVRWIADGRQGLAAALGGRFDVLVVDRMLPGLSGMEVLRELRARADQTPILMLTALSALEERVEGLEEGADDYLGKPFAFSELLARTRALCRRAHGRESIDDEQITVADLEIRRKNQHVTRAGRRIDLTPQEYRLLEFLARHAGQTVTRTMLLENLWNYEFDPRTNILDAHVSRLRAKLDRGHDVPLLRTLRGVGYILDARE